MYTLLKLLLIYFSFETNDLLRDVHFLFELWPVLYSGDYLVTVPVDYYFLHFNEKREKMIFKAIVFCKFEFSEMSSSFSNINGWEPFSIRISARSILVKVPLTFQLGSLKRIFTSQNAKGIYVIFTTFYNKYQLTKEAIYLEFWILAWKRPLKSKYNCYGR